MTPNAVTTLRWAAAVAVALALIAFAAPDAARPLVSVVVGGALVLLAVAAIRTVQRRLPTGTTSPFRQRRVRTSEELPSELRRLTAGMKGLKPHATIPEPAYWALRRITHERLVLRHGRRYVAEDDVRTLAATLSRPLFNVLTIDSDRNPIRGDEFADLISEVEQL